MSNAEPDQHDDNGDYAPRTFFFGLRWNAPAFEDAERVATPVGLDCLYCEEPVAEGDSGIITPAMLTADSVQMLPVHIECHLRSLLGGLAHLEQRCSCYGGGEHDGHTRDDARAVLSWVIARQVKQGIPDPGFVTTP